MNFEFSDEQKQMAAEARRFLAAKCPTAAVRAILEGPEAYDKALWKGLAEMGFLGVVIVVHPGVGGLHPAFLLAFGAMLAYAFFMLLTRYLAASDKPLAMLFYSILLGTFAMAPIAAGAKPFPMPATGKRRRASSRRSKRCGRCYNKGSIALRFRQRYPPALRATPSTVRFGT